MTCFHLPARGCRALRPSRLRPSRFCGTRKRSVPVRVHSVGKNFGFTGRACALPASNPFLTHGTVESPAKLFPLTDPCVVKVMECDRLQSVQQSFAPTLSLAGGRTPKFKFSLYRRRLPEHSLGIVIARFAHHVPGRPGQLARQRLGRDHVAGFGCLALKPFSLRLFPPPA